MAGISLKGDTLKNALGKGNKTSKLVTILGIWLSLFKIMEPLISLFFSETFKFKHFDSVITKISWMITNSNAKIYGRERIWG